MLRSALENELDRLQNELLDLGNLVYQSIVKSIEILKEGDIDAAKRLIAADKDVNRKRFEIESDVLVLIARQQPMARDLRTMAAVLCIATELERIADYSKSNARNTIKLGTKPPVTILEEISRMAEQASDMLQGALKSFTGRDVEMARSIASRDPDVDRLYDRIYRESMAMWSSIREASKRQVTSCGSPIISNAPPTGRSISASGSSSPSPEK